MRIIREVTGIILKLSDVAQAYAGIIICSQLFLSMIRKQNLPSHKKRFQVDCFVTNVYNSFFTINHKQYWTLNFQVEGEQEEEPPRKKIRLLKVAVVV